MLSPIQLDPLYVGDGAELRLTLTADGAVYDLTGCRVGFAMRPKTATTGATITKKNAACVGGSASQIEMTSPTTGVATILIDSTDTAALATGRYEWDVVVEPADQRERTVAYGTIFVVERVTPALA